MQNHISHAQNTSWFNKNAGDIPKFMFWGAICQIISGLTEFAIIENFITQNIPTLSEDVDYSVFQFFTVFWTLSMIFLWVLVRDVKITLIFTVVGAFTLWITRDLAPITTMAIMATVGLEFGIMLMVGTATNRWLKKKEDGFEWLLTIITTTIASLLILVSIFFSTKGLQDLGHSWADRQEENKSSKVESKYDKKRNQALADYERYEGKQDKIFDNKIAQIKAEYDAKIEGAEVAILDYQQKELRSKKKYTSSINRERKKRANYREKKAAKIKELESEKGKKLGDYLESKESKLSNYESESTNKLDSIASTTLLSKNAWSIGSGMVIIICLFVAVFCHLSIAIIKHRSGIKTTPQPTDYFYREGILKTYMEKIKERWNQKAYQYIDDFSEKTEMPSVPAATVLYEKPSDQIKVKVNNKQIGERELEITKELPQKLRERLNTPSVLNHQNQPILNAKTDTVLTGKTDTVLNAKTSKPFKTKETQPVLTAKTNTSLNPSNKPKTDSLNVQEWDVKTGEKAKTKTENKPVQVEGFRHPSTPPLSENIKEKTNTKIVYKTLNNDHTKLIKNLRNHYKYAYSSSTDEARQRNWNKYTNEKEQLEALGYEVREASKTSLTIIHPS